MSLLFNMLSRFLIAFPPRSKHLLISLAAVNFGAQKIKSVLASTFPPSYVYDFLVIAATVIGLLLYQIPAKLRGFTHEFPGYAQLCLHMHLWSALWALTGPQQS